MTFHAEIVKNVGEKRDDFMTWVEQHVNIADMHGDHIDHFVDVSLDSCG